VVFCVISKKQNALLCQIIGLSSGRGGHQFQI
jgi:hypothetical protein